MTDNLPRALQEDLTCHICTEIYTDPVQLPCQHSFCRGCLKIYVSSHAAADNIKDACGTLSCEQADDTCARATRAHSNVVSCPICRKPVELDHEAVSRLAVHFTIANIVEKYHIEVKKEVSLKCSMCEGDNPRTAFKGCLICRCLYCQECLDSLHPKRGALSDHNLVDVWDYVLSPTCKEHKEPLKVFCADCRNVYCLMCTYKRHNGHDLKEPDAVFIEEKGRLGIQTSQMKKLQQDVQRSVVELTVVDESIRKCFDDQIAEIDGINLEFVKALDNWKSGRLGSIIEQRDALLRQTSNEMKRLGAHADELVACLNSAIDLETQTDSIRFLLAYESMVKRMDNVSNSADDILQIFQNCKTGIKDSKMVKENSGELMYLMNKKDKQSLEFSIIHQPITCPGFSLNKVLDDSVSIQDNGKLLMKVRQSGNNAVLRGALADQSFQSGRVYWETDVTYKVKTELAENSRVYSAGLLHRSDKPPPVYLGKDGHSWGLAIEQKLPRSLVCWHNKTRCSTYPAHPDGSVKGGTIRQGFYLDCVNRTFAIFDCTHDRVLHVFRDLDLLESLTPAVAMYNSESVDVSVRLRTGQDINTLPPCLYNMFQRL